MFRVDTNLFRLAGRKRVPCSFGRPRVGRRRGPLPAPSPRREIGSDETSLRPSVQGV